MDDILSKLRQALGGQVVLPGDWETTAEVIRVTGRNVLGVSSGRRKEDKETWWWNEEVQDSIQRKKLAKKKWDMDRTEENRQEYKELQRRVKREVSKAKQKAYDELYTRLDTREGEKDLYRLARQRDRDGKDVQQVRVIKDRDGRVLTNLEKAHDRVPREELWYCMRKSGVAEKYVRVVQDMYERSRTVVRCAVEEVRQESPCTMMFADDIVICSESREQVEENLERWRFALERRGMKVSRSKTEYMCVNEREGSGTVRLQGEEVKKVQEFKYLGSTVQSNGECGKEDPSSSIRLDGEHQCTAIFSSLQRCSIEFRVVVLLEDGLSPQSEVQSTLEHVFIKDVFVLLPVPSAEKHFHSMMNASTMLHCRDDIGQVLLYTAFRGLEGARKEKHTISLCIKRS
ncbi:hypothetical protein QTP86_012841 [Hemibagrus guttatus]|nr:hypothetical protein QTP86_012841 [Hemibagrus guttatus]